MNSLLQEFHFAKPEVLTKLINLYATSFYSSGTWDIFSKDCEKLYKSWNVTIRQVFNLNWTTHRYLIEPISGCLHPKVMLAARYVTFYKSLVNSSKFPVRFISRLKEQDRRSVLGRNLLTILEECNLSENSMENLTANLVKKNLRYFKVPEAEQWRLPILGELLMIREDNVRVDNLETNEVEEMIEHICIS